MMSLLPSCDFLSTIKSYVVDEQAKRVAAEVVASVVKAFRDTDYDKCKRRFDEMFNRDPSRLRALLGVDHTERMSVPKFPTAKRARGMFQPR